MSSPPGSGRGVQHPRERKLDGYPDLGHAVWPIGANAYQRLQEEQAENWEQGGQICDFIVKYGSVTVGNVFKVKQQTTLNVLKTQSQKFIQRILVEAEYCPCVVANSCWGILQCSLCRWPSPWSTLTCVWMVTMFQDFLLSSCVPNTAPSYFIRILIIGKQKFAHSFYICILSYVISALPVLPMLHNNDVALPPPKDL